MLTDDWTIYDWTKIVKCIAILDVLRDESVVAEMYFMCSIRKAKYFQDIV